MQFQSDILDVNVVRPEIIETTALGAAYLAGLAVGFWRSPEDISNYWVADKTYSPVMGQDERDGLVKGWNRAVKAAIAWGSESE
jgi:glycerol kinase